jgi:hypothetical protein
VLILPSFADWRLFQASAEIKKRMNTDWAYPSILWDEVCHTANGYAGFARHVHVDGSTINDSERIAFLTYQNSSLTPATQQRRGFNSSSNSSQRSQVSHFQTTNGTK